MALEIKKNVSLAQYTTLHVGGIAEYAVEVMTVDELKEALQFAKQTEAPPFILGGGSNVLIADEGYRGLVIINRLLGRQYEVQGDVVLLTCGSGEWLDAVVAESVEKGYWGLENLSAIPGTVGATPVQNVGAYGVEVSDLIVAVKALHRENGEEKIFTASECLFGYRDSFFKSSGGADWIVTEVTFSLSRTPKPLLEYGALIELKAVQVVTPQMVRTAVMKIRAGKFPDWRTVGTAGSFFKNPVITTDAYNALLMQFPALPGFPTNDAMVKVPLGFILDKICDLRGYCENGVCLYKEQALVLVTVGKVDAKTIDAFAKKITAIVKEKTDISIEREVRSVQ